MVENFNPAERLLIILQKAHSQKGTIKEVWSTVFGIHHSNVKELLWNLSNLIALSNEVLICLRNNPETNNELYKLPFKNVEQLLSLTNFDVSWEGAKGLLNEKVMFGLQHCSYALSKLSAEKRIDEKQLEDLRNDVETLINKILKGNISNELKEIFVENLENIRRAILAYKINGSEGLRRAFESSLGSIIHNRELVKKEENKEISSVFFDIIDKLNKLFSFAKSAKEYLLPYIDNFLQ
jgi:hypothetical protein